jgi:hypothetical protein
VRDVTARAPGIRRPLAAAAIVLLLAWSGIDQIRTRHQRDATTEYRDLGRDLNRFAQRDDAMLLTGMTSTESFYLDPWYVDMFATASFDSYRGMVDLKKKGSLLVDRVVAVVPEGAALDFTRENLPRIRELGSVRVIEAETVAAEMPGLARRWPNRGFFVLTLD